VLSVTLALLARTRKSCILFSGCVSEVAGFGAGTLRISDTSIGSSLALKFKSLGADPDDLDVLLQAVKRHVRVAAGADVVRPGEPVRRSTVLLAGMACCYERSRDGGRSIFSFQHAGDFCDLYRYVLPERDGSVGVQALTDCSVAIIDYRDMDRLLAQPKLALAFWRVTMLEAAIYRERRTNASHGTALERVASLLCEQLVRCEAVGSGGARLPISQIDVADATGLSVVHVNRTIQTLRGLYVLSEASHLEVIDRKQLAYIAKFDGRYLNMPKLLSNWTVRVEEPPV
jgi:CRP-like cAMP-binding protein